MVLAIDDEPGVLKLIKLALSSQGFRVITAESGEAGIRMEEEHRPDIAVVDLVMGEMDGYEVMRRLRDRTNIPVILLTAKGSDADRVKGLELGADDYLPKPFGPDELCARVRAVLRRSVGGPGIEQTLQCGPVSIDLHRRIVTRDGEAVTLTRTEWMLLQHLAANPGRIMLNGELLSKVWGPEYKGDLQYLRVWVSRLRKKLEADPSNPQLIKTFQGIGYMLETPEGEGAASPHVEDASGAEPEETLVAS
jgi:two-component system KDP operon response regulator KdpE